MAVFRAWDGEDVARDERELLRLTGADSIDALADQLFGVFDGVVELVGDEAIVLILGPPVRGHPPTPWPCESSRPSHAGWRRLRISGRRLSRPASTI